MLMGLPVGAGSPNRLDWHLGALRSSDRTSRLSTMKATPLETTPLKPLDQTESDLQSGFSSGVFSDHTLPSGPKTYVCWPCGMSTASPRPQGHLPAEILWIASPSSKA